MACFRLQFDHDYPFNILSLALWNESPIKCSEGPYNWSHSQPIALAFYSRTLSILLYALQKVSSKFFQRFSWKSNAKKFHHMIADCCLCLYACDWNSSLSSYSASSFYRRGLLELYSYLARAVPSRSKWVLDIIRAGATSMTSRFIRGAVLNILDWTVLCALVPKHRSIYLSWTIHQSDPFHDFLRFS